MKKKIIKISFALTLVISLFSFSLLANKDAIIEMAGQSVSENDRFNQARLELSGQGLIDLVDQQILDQDYSFKNNKEVKKEVNTQIKEIEDSNPDILSNYPTVDNIEDLLQQFGSILDIQRTAYAKDVYVKEYVSEKSLRKLYDAKAGEVTSFYLIRLSEDDFDDETEFNEAISDIEAKLTAVNKDDIVETFTALAKTYPGNENDPNGEKTGVAREELSSSILKIIDKYEYLEFNKKALNDDDMSTFFILKTDKGKRASFKESKDRLTTLQFENAKNANPYLEMYLLYQLRTKNDVKFEKASDQKMYDLVNQEIVKQYRAAKDGDN